MIICPNLSNPEVAREFEELKQATSEQAAYHIWSLNNGNAIDRAPNGAPSKLFLTLLEHYNGDRVKAIQAKAKTYGRSFLLWFGNWTEQRNTKPLVKFYGPTMGKTTAAKSNPNLVDFDDLVRADIKKLANKLGKTVREVKTESGEEYKQLLLDAINEWKNNPENIGKTLLVSNAVLAKEEIFDNNVSIPSRDVFVKRLVERSEEDKSKEELTLEAELYYDDLMSKWYDNPVIENNYVSDLEQDVSKVVDENGEPLVVYHGTSRMLNNNSFNSEFIFASDNDIIGAGYAFQRKGFSTGIDYALSNFAGEDINSFREHVENHIKALENEIELGEDMPFYQEGDLDAKKNLLKELKNAKQEIKSRDIFKEFEPNVFNIFQNVKNPLTVDAKGKYWHSIEFEGTTKYTDEIAKIAKDRGYDGLIITNVIDKGAEVSKNGEFAEVANDYIAFEPNQIKSATDNQGAFSRENDDIYYHIQGKLIKTVQDVKDVLSDILELYYDFHNWLGTRITLNKRNEESYDDQISFVLNLFELPSKTMWINSGGFLQFNDKLIQDNLYKFKDRIDSHGLLSDNYIKNRIRLGELFSSLQKKFPNIKKIVPAKLVGANAKFENGCVYINLENVTSDTLVEECLHPFVEAIYAENRQLFDNLLKEARKEFPKLRAEIAVTYKDDKFTREDRYKELVTLALSRHYADIYVNGKSKEKSIWKLALDWILEMLGVGNIDQKTTLGELADALYEAESVYVDKKYYNTESFNLNQQQSSVLLLQLKTLGAELMKKCKG